MYQCLGHISYLMKRTCTGYAGNIAYGFRTVSLIDQLVFFFGFFLQCENKICFSDEIGMLNENKFHFPTKPDKFDKLIKVGAKFFFH